MKYGLYGVAFIHRCCQLKEANHSRLYWLPWEGGFQFQLEPFSLDTTGRLSFRALSSTPIYLHAQALQLGCLIDQAANHIKHDG